MTEIKSIMTLEQALVLFEKEIGFESSIFVEITSRGNPKHFETSLEIIELRHKNFYNYDLRQVPKLKYTHPGIGHKPSLPPRKESLPIIESIDKHYIIVDDLIHTGEQCAGAAKHLLRSEVPHENIWLLMRDLYVF